MVQRLTYRRRHSYATKSNRQRVVKTPGAIGESVHADDQRTAAGDGASAGRSVSLTARRLPPGVLQVASSSTSTRRSPSPSRCAPSLASASMGYVGYGGDGRRPQWDRTRRATGVLGESSAVLAGWNDALAGEWGSGGAPACLQGRASLRPSRRQIPASLHMLVTDRGARGSQFAFQPPPARRSCPPSSTTT